MWVAVDDQDNPVGFTVVIIMGDRIHLHKLSVDPEHRRKGLGTRLTKTIIQFAKRAKFGCVAKTEEGSQKSHSREAI